MKLLLDMYRSAPKEQRDKVQLMAAEKKAKAEVNIISLFIFSKFSLDTLHLNCDGFVFKIGDCSSSLLCHLEERLECSGNEQGYFGVSSAGKG